MHSRSEVYPEDIQALARYVLGPPRVAGPARGQPRRHRRDGHRRPGGVGPRAVTAEHVRVRSRQSPRDRRDRDLHPEADEGADARRPRQRLQGRGLPLRRHPRLGAGRPHRRPSTGRSRRSTTSARSSRASSSRTATPSIVAVADASLSTRCGAHGATIETAIARAVAAVGLSAVFFQDMFGLVTFDDQLRAGRRGASHASAARTSSTAWTSTSTVASTDTPSGAARRRHGHRGPAAARRRVVPVISDFLFADAERVVRRAGRW